MISFIFHCAWLRWDRRSEWHYAGLENPARDSCGPSMPQDDYLDSVVRPLYRHVFDQTYCGLSGASPRSRPKLRAASLSFGVYIAYDFVFFLIRRPCLTCP